MIQLLPTSPPPRLSAPADKLPSQAMLALLSRKQDLLTLVLDACPLSLLYPTAISFFSGQLFALLSRKTSLIAPSGSELFLLLHNQRFAHSRVPKSPTL